MSQADGSEWRRRYAQRATTWREIQARQAAQAQDVDWDPAAPYGPGIDGALYTPGWREDGPGAVLLIKTRAMTELIRGWDSHQQMQDWVASRGTTGSGRLAVPAAARQARCVAEETVLSHMLANPGDAAAIGVYLPPRTWTSDVRHDLASAILLVARTGRRHGFAEHVVQALEQRAPSIPPSQLRQYGGRGMRWARQYLARLDETPVPVENARSAAMALRMEDAQAASMTARRRSASGRRWAAPGVDPAPSRRAVATAGSKPPEPRI